MEILIGMAGAALMLGAFALGWVIGGVSSGHKRGAGGPSVPAPQSWGDPPPPQKAEERKAREEALAAMMSYDVATAYGQTGRDEE